MKRLLASPAVAVALVVVLVAGCSQAAPVPAQAPAKSAEPTKAPAATAAPTKAAEPTKAPQAPPAEPSKATAAAPPAESAKKVLFPEPGRTISMIVPWDPGGAGDLSGRLLAQAMEKELGVPVQVVNKPGAGTQVGITALATSKPDGYTIGQLTFPTAIITYLDPERKAAYSRKDFHSIAMYHQVQASMAVKADSPFKSAKDVVDAAKASPGKVTTGTGSLYGPPHLAHVALERAANIRLAYVHFNGGAPATNALLGGQTQVTATSVASVAQHVASGAARLLGVFDTERSRLFPDVKTFAEQGYKAASLDVKIMAVPAGTPREIIQILERAIKKATEDRDFDKKHNDMSIEVRYMGAAQADSWWAEQEPDVKELLAMAAAQQKQ